jgi:hypothetical protein
MAEERNVGLTRASDSTADADSTKAELQRRMEEARESITQTVTEIKDTVVTQYQQVKENISDTLDWREQYKRHTLPFTLTAFAVGTLLGYTVMGAFKGDGDDEYDEDEQESFDRIDAGFERGVKGSARRSYAAQPVLSGGGGDYTGDVGPETRPSYSSGYQAPTAPPPAAQSLASYASSSPADAGQEQEEPKGPGLIERFKETKAYDRLQEELSTLGERAIEELSRTARNVVVPALLGKLKGLIGLDLSGKGGGQQQQSRGGSRQQAVGGGGGGGGTQQQPYPSAYPGGAPGQGGSQPQGSTSTQGGTTSDPAGPSARAAAGGTEGYGAS